MRTKTTMFTLLGIVALAALLAGCGDSTASTAGSTTTSGYGSTPTAATATAAPAANSDLPVKTASVQVKGAAQTILTTATGLTLYYRTVDAGTNVFVGPTWPPLLATGSAPTSSVTLPGTLAVLTDGNGAQVTYNGHPLYTYAGDAKAGDANGEGAGNVWFVVKPDLAKATSLGADLTPTPGGYGY